MFYYGLEWQSLDSYLQFKEITAPSTPPTNELRQYCVDSGGISTICWLNDAGNTTCLPTGGGTIPTGTGSNGAVTFWTGTNTLSADATHFFWDNTNDQLLLGIASGSHLGTDAGLLTDEDASSSILGAAAHSATASHGGAVNLMRSRGTHATSTIVQSADRIGRLVGQGYDGSAYRDATAIDMMVDGTPGASDMPGRLVFLTTPDGSTTLTERARINAAGDMSLSSVGTANYAGFTRALTIESATNTAVELASSRADADAAGLGFLEGRYLTNTTNHNRVANVQFKSDGTTANQRGGRVTFATKADASTTLSDRWAITQAGILQGLVTGGSIIKGGTASGDDLTLESTSNATLGSIILGATNGDNRVVINNTETDITIGGVVVPVRLGIHGGIDGAEQLIEFHKFSNTASSGAQIEFARSRGTSGSRSVVQSGDRIGGIGFLGYDGTDYEAAASIRVEVDGTPGAGDMPGRMLFSTTPDGAASHVERMRITQAGLVGVGITSPTSILHVGDTSTSAARGYVVDQFTNDAGGATFVGRKTRGTSEGSFTAVASSDAICSFRSHGSDGTSFGTGFAFLRTLATEAFTATAQGTKVQIQTVANGGTTASVVLDIGQDKVVTLPVTSSYIDLTAITSKVFKVPTDNTDPTGGGGAATGRIPIHDAAGNLRYIPYY